jgi:predicted nucleic acid-binding protein
MTVDDVTTGTAVFLDANVLLYSFAAHPTYGDSCTRLLDRIEQKDLAGYTSTHVLGEVIHRLMTIEACTRFGWAPKGIARQLRRHPTEVQQLTRPRQAVDEVTATGIEVLAVVKLHVSTAVDVSAQAGLLSNDALVVAVMRDHGLTHLASHDRDFDRVPALIRYEPV